VAGSCGPRVCTDAGVKVGDLIAQGDYLVNRATLCSDCHTPRDDRGNLDRKRQLRGTTISIRPKKETKDWADESPDISPRGLAGKWSEEQMIGFLTTGIDPDRHQARRPMPPFRLNANDARAITLYLKSLPGPDEGSKE
jgi:hypothetical protein